MNNIKMNTKIIIMKKEKRNYNKIKTQIDGIKIQINQIKNIYKFN